MTRSVRRARSRRFGGKATGALAAVAVVVGATSAPASGYDVLGGGCRYDPANDNDGLGIGFDTGGSLYNSTERLNVEYSASAWNALMTPQFTVVSWGSSQRDLAVKWSNLGVNVGGTTSLACSAGSNHYTSDPVFEFGANATYYSSTQARRMAISIHEIGHSYGLDHYNASGCDDKTAGLMYTDAVAKTNLCGWTDPTWDDVAGAIDAHNG